MSFRRDFISKPIFSFARSVLPAMSDTEREALEAGDEHDRRRRRVRPDLQLAHQQLAAREATVDGGQVAGTGSAARVEREEGGKDLPRAPFMLLLDGHDPVTEADRSSTTSTSARGPRSGSQARLGSTPFTK